MQTCGKIIWMLKKKPGYSCIFQRDGYINKRKVHQPWAIADSRATRRSRKVRTAESRESF